MQRIPAMELHVCRTASEREFCQSETVFKNKTHNNSTIAEYRINIVYVISSDYVIKDNSNYPLYAIDKTFIKR